MNQERYNQARDAYDSDDLLASKRAHLLPIHSELHSLCGQYLKSFIYGGMDGIITIFSIITASMGSKLGQGVIIVLGVANLLGNGLSMALGDYLSSKSEEEFRNSERKREEKEIEEDPFKEIAEMEEIYMKKGIDHHDAKLLALTLSKCKVAWVDVMMSQELGFIDGEIDSVKNGIVTFFSFLIFGLIPLAPFLIGYFYDVDSEKMFMISSALLAITLFLLGAAKTKIVSGNMIKHGIEVLIVGGFAAGVAFMIGILLEPLAN